MVLAELASKKGQMFSQEQARVCIDGGVLVEEMGVPVAQKPKNKGVVYIDRGAWGQGQRDGKPPSDRRNRCPRPAPGGEGGDVASRIDELAKEGPSPLLRE